MPKLYYDEKYADGIGFDRTVEKSPVHALCEWYNPREEILDIGCGLGQDCEAMRQHNLRPTGIDQSSVGIGTAKTRYPDVEFVCADLAQWEPDRVYDGIWCRGMSWYHYDLDGTIGRSGVDVPRETRRLMSWIKPGGKFVFLINTDLGGSRPAGREHYNRINDYLLAFEGFELLYLLWQRNFIVQVWKNTPSKLNRV